MDSASRGIVFRQIERLFSEGTLAGLGDGQLLERYITRRDEAAFEALVDLHGPMVLGLCRRMLHDPRDVEDAFQATFLILVRKASAIRDQTLLSNWLYGVAYRVAVRARANTMRRRGREVTAPELDVAAVPEAMDHHGMGPVLDQELSRLPEKYRAPLVLCYLRSRTHDQAAEELRCPVGTVRSRLARGRDLLRDRLTRRGYAPTVAGVGTGAALPTPFLAEAVPPSLVAATLRSAFELSSIEVVSTGAIASTALTLTQGTLTAMKFVQLKAIGLAVAATALSIGGVVAVSYVNAQTPASADSSPSVATAVEAPGEPAAQSRTVGTPPPVQIQDSGVQVKALENKLDQILARVSQPLASSGTPAVPVGSARPAPTAIRPEEGSLRSIDTTNRSFREHEAQLKLALVHRDRYEKLFQAKAIPSTVWDEAKGKVTILLASLSGLNEDFGNELERLRLERMRKNMELDRENAKMEIATAVVARNQELNGHKPGMVHASEVVAANAELKVAIAQVNIKKIEIEEVDLQAEQLRSSRERVSTLLKSALPTKDGVGTTEPPSVRDESIHR